jgi:hypothetical protein
VLRPRAEGVALVLKLRYLSFGMGKRGPKPQGRVKTLVSLDPEQLTSLRLVAGYLSAKWGVPVDVSGVVRFALMASPSLKQLHAEALKEFVRLNATPDGGHSMRWTLAAQGGRPNDETDFRELFENASHGVVPQRENILADITRMEGELERARSPRTRESLQSAIAFLRTLEAKFERGEKGAEEGRPGRRPPKAVKPAIAKGAKP